MTRRIALLGTLLALGTAGPEAQRGAADARPAFEVASIRQNVSADQGASVRPRPGGGLTVTNNTFFNIVRNAYSVQGVQVVGATDWMTRDRWDIVAKAEGDTRPADLMLMLQSLLAERFKADIRRETRE